MNFTQNEKISQVSDETLVIGIDITSETQYARAFDFRGIEVSKVFKFDSNATGFQNFLKRISDLSSLNISELNNCLMVYLEILQL